MRALHFAAFAHRHAQPHAGMLLRQSREQIRHLGGTKVIGDAKTQFALQRRFVQIAPGFVAHGKQALCVGEQHQPGSGWLNTALAAHQQQLARAVFELLQLLARGRLRQKNFGCARRHAAAFHDMHKGSELIDFKGLHCTGAAQISHGFFTAFFTAST